MVRNSGWREAMEERVDRSEAIDAVTEVKSHAESTVEGFDWDWEISRDGLRFWIEGKQEDLKSLQSEVEDIWRGYGFQITLDIDYDYEVNAESALVAEITPPSDKIED